MTIQLDNIARILYRSPLFILSITKFLEPLVPRFVDVVTTVFDFCNKVNAFTVMENVEEITIDKTNYIYAFPRKFDSPTSLRHFSASSYSRSPSPSS